MNTHTKRHELEAKARKMADGFRSIPEQGMQFAFRSGAMVPMQVAHRLQAIADGFQAIRDAEAARLTAEDALEKALPEHHSYFEEAGGVLRAHFGSYPRRRATFGIEEVRRPTRRRSAPKRGEREVVRTTVIERPGRGREPEVEVIETEETVETTERPRPERRRARSAAANSAGTPLPGAMPLPSMTPPASATQAAKTAKKKAGRN